MSDYYYHVGSILDFFFFQCCIRNESCIQQCFKQRPHIISYNYLSIRIWVKYYTQAVGRDSHSKL